MGLLVGEVHALVGRQCWHNWGFDWAHRTVIYNHRTYIPHSTTFANRNNFRRTTNNFHRTSSNFRHNTNSFNHAQRGSQNACASRSSSHSAAFSGFNHGGIARSFPPVGAPASVGDFTAVVFMEAGAADNRLRANSITNLKGATVMRKVNTKLESVPQFWFFWPPSSSFWRCLCGSASPAPRRRPNRPMPLRNRSSQALYQAVQNGNEQAILQILGGRPELASSGDDLKDKAERKQFATKYQESHRLVR